MNCTAGQTITGAVNAIPPSTSYVQINVEGACSDNVYIPPNLAVALVGAKGASLSPATASSATITTEGRLIVGNLKVTTGDFAALFVNRGGYLTVQGGSITGPGNGVQVSDNSGALLQNVTIDVTGFAGVNTYAGAQVEIDGIAALYGVKETTIAGGTAGVACGPGSLELSASGGDIILKKSGQFGIQTNACSINTYVASGFAIEITGNGEVNGYGAGINAEGASYIQLSNVTITNNAYDGVNAFNGASVQINGSTITGNGYIAVGTSQTPWSTSFPLGGSTRSPNPAPTRSRCSVAIRAAGFTWPRSPTS